MSSLQAAMPRPPPVPLRPPLLRAYPFGLDAAPSSMPTRQEVVGYVETADGQLLKGTRAW